MSLPRSLWLKSLIVGTPFEGVARQVRSAVKSIELRRHPELGEFCYGESLLPQVLKSVLTPTSQCVDVGSHIGSFLSLALRYASDGRHIAFEPSVEKCQWLVRRFPNVEIKPVGVADQNGRTMFVEDRERPGYSHLSAGDAKDLKKHTYAVDVVRLDDVLIDRQPALIKIDVEGGELEVLRGAADTIRRTKPSIIFECGSEYADLVKEKRPQLFRFLVDDLSYSIRSFSDYMFGKDEMGFDEFRRCGLYPFRAFNFIAMPASFISRRIAE